MSEQTNGRLGDLTFHMGIDYACVMGEHQTTEAPIARLFGISKDVEAYGKLFAAAPEMLAALKEALNSLEVYVKIYDRKWDGSAAEGSTVELVRAAIAKATGSTP